MDKSGEKDDDDDGDDSGAAWIHASGNMHIYLLSGLFMASTFHFAISTYI